VSVCQDGSVPARAPPAAVFSHCRIPRGPAAASPASPRPGTDGAAEPFGADVYGVVDAIQAETSQKVARRDCAVGPVCTTLWHGKSGEVKRLPLLIYCYRVIAMATCVSRHPQLRIDRRMLFEQSLTARMPLLTAVGAFVLWISAMISTLVRESCIS